MRDLQRQSQTASLMQPRTLRREWKRYKPHLQKSISLPALQLIPPNRPIFQCRCGYTNAWVPLCLWCEWTSDEATKAFYGSMPRSRTVSAPAGMVCRHLKSLDARAETQTGWVRTLARKASAESVESSLPPVTPRDETYHDPSKIPHLATVLAEDSDQLLSSFEDSKTRRSSKRCGFIAGFNNPDTCRPSSTVSKPWVSKSQNKAHPTSTRGCIPTFTLAPESIKETSTGSTERFQPNIMESTFLVPPRTSHLQPNIANAAPMEASSSLGPPQRTVRRKKRMTLLKQKSSRSLRTRASAPLLNSDGDGNSHRDEHRPFIQLQPTPQTSATVRLGHPNRPYYSAIRPNMSRPNSPANTSSLSPSRAASPSRSIICSNTFHPPSLALSSATSRVSYPHPITSSTIGFSMSGETELRMALARWRSLESGEPTEYRFHDMETPRGKGGRSNGRLGGKMKRLGMGIMELVLGRK